VDEVIAPSRGDHLTDDQAMRLAMREARKGAGFVSPNPQVGCVIVDSHNRFLSKGYHEKFGGPHAEINALKNLNSAELENARIFVTLEPCAHEGKTPSCAKALAQLPIAEVIFGLIDPNPLVSGKGAEILRTAGKKVTEFGKWQDDLEEVCEQFLVNFRERKIFVSVKVASSLDGQLAMKTGESKWITGEKARDYGHYLRGTHDAILAGKNTILMDNSQLNIRHPQFHDKKGKEILLDRKGETLNNADLRIFTTHSAENIIIAVEDNAKVHSKYGKVLTHNGLKDLLTKLWELGIRSILIEGGASVISSFLNQGLVNRLYLFQAPLLLGAKSGKAWSEQVMIESIDKKILMKNPKMTNLGVDWLITGRIS
jgi:diaminohydroxyphosphoribosylaminopyrimidine deaminase/5-amino-6-(5-phosphoribosylamino)uracil reductase